MAHFVTPWGENESAGKQIGQGFSEGLEQLAQMKLDQMKRRKQEQAFKDMGLPPGLASLDPTTQSSYLKQYGAAQQLSQGKQQAGPQAKDILGKLGETREKGLSSNSWIRSAFGYEDPEKYNAYSKQLEKTLKPYYKDMVFPNAKMDPQTQQEFETNILDRLAQDLGEEEAEQILSQISQESGIEPDQQMEQPEGPEGFMGALARNAGRNAPAAAAYSIPGVRELALGGQGLAALGNIASEQLPSQEKLKKQYQERAKTNPKAAEEYELAEKIRKDSSEPLKGPVEKVKEWILPESWQKPKNEAESTLDEFVEDVALLRPATGIGRAIKTAAAGITGKTIAKGAGLPPLAQAAFKIGFGGLADSVPGFRDKMNEKVEPAIESFKEAAKGDKASMGELKAGIRNKLDYLYENKNAANDKLIKQLQPIYENIGGANTMDMATAVDKIEHLMDESTLAGLSDSGKDYLAQVRDDLEKGLKKGSRVAKIPEYKDYSDALKIREGFKASEFATNNLKDMAKGKGWSSGLLRSVLKSSGPAGAVGAAAGYAAGGGKGALAGALAGAATGDVYKFAKFLNETPGAMKDWGKLMVDSSLNRKGSALNTLSRIDKKAAQWERIQGRKKK